MASQLGLRLKALREFYGWSQRELAKRAGVPNSAISVIEQGAVSPSVLSLEKVLKGFPITLADFFAIDIARQAVAVHSGVGPGASNAVSGLRWEARSERHGAQLRTYCNRPEDDPLTLVLRGENLLLITAGEGEFNSLSTSRRLVAGDSLSLSCTTPVRLQAFDFELHWVLLSFA